MSFHPYSTPAGWLRSARRLLVCAGLVALAGCATPAERIGQLAAARGYERREIQGDGFRHVAFVKPGAGRVVHVYYLEHDGAPWPLRTVVARDPTPRRPLMFDLMGLDPAPAVYLGRPCYLGMATSAGCTPLAWTHARYSERGVVTLAGNLDIAAWAALHGYSPLQGSLDPAQRAAASRPGVELHYVGSRDANTPARLARGCAARRPGGRVIEVPGFDHLCCWRAARPGILEEFEAAVVAARPQR